MTKKAEPVMIAAGKLFFDRTNAAREAGKGTHINIHHFRPIVDDVWTNTVEPEVHAQLKRIAAADPEAAAKIQKGILPKSVEIYIGEAAEKACEKAAEQGGDVKYGAVYMRTHKPSKPKGGLGELL